MKMIEKLQEPNFIASLDGDRRVHSGYTFHPTSEELTNKINELVDANNELE
jgi:hypothetical protein